MIAMIADSSATQALAESVSEWPSPVKVSKSVFRRESRADTPVVL